MFSETDIINVFELLIDNIFVILVDVFFNIQSAYLWVQTVLRLFLYSYEADFIQGLLTKNERKLVF